MQLLSSSEVGKKAQRSTLLLHPNARAFMTLPLSLLMKNVTLHFFHRNPAPPARHGMFPPFQG